MEEDDEVHPASTRADRSEVGIKYSSLREFKDVTSHSALRARCDLQ